MLNILKFLLVLLMPSLVGYNAFAASSPVAGTCVPVTITVQTSTGTSPTYQNIEISYNNNGWYNGPSCTYALNSGYTITTVDGVQKLRIDTPTTSTTALVPVYLAKPINGRCPNITDYIVNTTTSVMKAQNLNYTSLPCSYSSSNNYVVCDLPTSVTSEDLICGGVYASMHNLVSISTSSAATSISVTYKCLPVVLNNNGEKFATYYRYQGSPTWYSNNTCTTRVTSIPVPSQENKAFRGFTNSSGTTCVSNTGALSTSTDCYVGGATSLTAQYSDCRTVTLKSSNTFTEGDMLLYKISNETGLYMDNTCTTGFKGTSISKPTRDGYTFRGFYSANLDDATANTSSNTNKQYISATGDITTLKNRILTSNLTLYPAWATNCRYEYCTLTVLPNGSVSYDTICQGGFETQDNGTYLSTCKGTYCGDAAQIVFWGLDNRGNLVSKETVYYNYENGWQNAQGASVEKFADFNFASSLELTGNVTVDGTAYANGITPYRAVWIGGTPPRDLSDLNEITVDVVVGYTSTKPVTNGSSYDIVISGDGTGGSLPDLKNLFIYDQTNGGFPASGNYLILYAARCLTEEQLDNCAQCWLAFAADGAVVYKNVCNPGCYAASEADLGLENMHQPTVDSVRMEYKKTCDM